VGTSASVDDLRPSVVPDVIGGWCVAELVDQGSESVDCSLYEPSFFIRHKQIRSRLGCSGRPKVEKGVVD
jgi:hypothetical protein